MTTGTRHELLILDGTKSVKDSVAPRKQKARHAYKVTAKTGLRKNGKDYAHGSSIMLDVDTATNFRASGDIE